MVRPTTEEVVRVALLLTSLWQPGGFSIYGSAAYANLDSHFASDTKAETAYWMSAAQPSVQKTGASDLGAHRDVVQDWAKARHVDDHVDQRAAAFPRFPCTAESNST